MSMRKGVNVKTKLYVCCQFTTSITEFCGVSRVTKPHSNTNQNLGLEGNRGEMVGQHVLDLPCATSHRPSRNMPTNAVARVAGELVVNGDAGGALVEGGGGEELLLGLRVLDFERDLVAADAEVRRVHRVLGVADLQALNE